MATSRLLGRRGDGSAVVRGWVAIYTLGLPRPMRERRRDEIAGHLADEATDAVRRGEVARLRGRRLWRWVLGIPDDVIWRLTDARAMAARYARPGWVPLSRWTAVLLAVVAIGAAGGFALVAVPYFSGPSDPAVWAGWGPTGFLIGTALILVGLVAAVPWPRAGAALALFGVGVGLPAAPWLWGCWGMVVIAVGMRWHQAATAT
jgi:hypothetical protein